MSKDFLHWNDKNCENYVDAYLPIICSQAIVPHDYFNEFQRVFLVQMLRTFCEDEASCESFGELPIRLVYKCTYLNKHVSTSGRDDDEGDDIFVQQETLRCERPKLVS